MRTTALFAAFVCAHFTLGAAAKAQEKELSGSLIKLVGEKKEFSTQPGGLVVVPIKDSGSRPPQDIAVDGGGLKKLGQVHGSQNEQGIPMQGGGYTWVLFTAEKAGNFKVKVSYTPNEEGAAKVEKVYTLKVEEREK